MKFDKIITVSLNPSFDVTLWLDTFEYDEPNMAREEKVYPAGKALNVSRVLTAFGQANKAIGLCGADNYKYLSRLMSEENLEFDFIECDGATRENFTVILPNKAMLKINRKGFNVTFDVMRRLQMQLKSEITADKEVLLIFAGSVPANLAASDFREYIIKCKAPNVKIVLDTDLFDCHDIEMIHPYIIKPNLQELKRMTKVNFRSESTILKCISSIAEYVDHVVVSIGSKGLLYSGKGGCYRASVPKVDVRSTVGAGDTTLAGFVTALQQEQPIDLALQFAAACGTASVMLDGTQATTTEQAMKVKAGVVMTRLG